LAFLPNLREQRVKCVEVGKQRWLGGDIEAVKGEATEQGTVGSVIAAFQILLGGYQFRLGDLGFNKCLDQEFGSGCEFFGKGLCAK
jgi:hypothetical protein